MSPTDRSSAVLYRARGIFDGVSAAGPSAGLLVEGGRVTAVGDAAELARSARAEHDFGTAVIVPGFVDAHTHVTLRPGEGDQDGQCEAPAAWQTIRGFANLRQIRLLHLSRLVRGPHDDGQNTRGQQRHERGDDYTNAA